MKELVLPKPFDAHYHFRDDFRLTMLMEHMVRWFSRATAMPNLNPPVWTAGDAVMYREKIREEALKYSGGESFEPVMTIYITPETTPQDIVDAHAEGVKAGKLYPKHGTFLIYVDIFNKICYIIQSFQIKDPLSVHSLFTRIARN